jgi:hypothetical protein
MTLEQAKQLVPHKDYVVYKGEIRKFLELDAPMIKLYESEGLNLLTLIENCHLLGEYRGCFTQEVFPPKYFEQDSVDVIILNTDNTMCIGFYNYEDKEWYTHSLVLTELNQFCWVFKPDYLK